MEKTDLYKVRSAHPYWVDTWWRGYMDDITRPTMGGRPNIKNSFYWIFDGDFTDLARHIRGLQILLVNPGCFSLPLTDVRWT